MGTLMSWASLLALAMIAVTASFNFDSYVACHFVFSPCQYAALPAPLMHLLDCAHRPRPGRPTASPTSVRRLKGEAVAFYRTEAHLDEIGKLGGFRESGFQAVIVMRAPIHGPQ